MNRTPLVLVLCVLAAPAAAAEDAAFRDRRTIHLCIRDLAAKKLRVRLDAERTLKQMGRRAVPELLRALDNRHVAVTTMTDEKNEVARARVAGILGAIGGDRPGARLVRALDDRSVLVQRAVINALGAMGHKGAAPELLKRTSSQRAAVACDAVVALGSIGDKAAVKTLATLLRSPDALKVKYKNDADAARVRSSAAFALGMLGDTAAVPALLRGLRDEAPRVRWHADLALRRMSGRAVGFDARAPAAGRERAAKAWDAWWEVKLRK